jgi:hypothetical protein
MERMEVKSRRGMHGVKGKCEIFTKKSAAWRGGGIGKLAEGKKSHKNIWQEIKRVAQRRAVDPWVRKMTVAVREGAATPQLSIST